MPRRNMELRTARLEPVVEQTCLYRQCVGNGPPIWLPRYLYLHNRLRED